MKFFNLFEQIMRNAFAIYPIHTADSEIETDWKAVRFGSTLSSYCGGHAFQQNFQLSALRCSEQHIV